MGLGELYERRLEEVEVAGGEERLEEAAKGARKEGQPSCS
jgi:hypothetical protein